jgi:hypothetical protein
VLILRIRPVQEFSEVVMVVVVVVVVVVVALLWPLHGRGAFGQSGSRGKPTKVRDWDCTGVGRY